RQRIGTHTRWVEAAHLESVGGRNGRISVADGARRPIAQRDGSDEPAVFEAESRAGRRERGVENDGRADAVGSRRPGDAERPIGAASGHARAANLDVADGELALTAE